MTEQVSTDVLIIGGGPAGMLSAIYLDLFGISSIVLERRFEISQHPKAHELSARSIEILCQMGFSLDELQEEASSYRDASRVLFGHTINTELGEIDLWSGGNDEKYKEHLASAEPYLNLSQTELEKLMRKKLSNCKHSQLLIGHQWESREEDGTGVVSQILNRKDECRFSIKSKYLICADGANSRSRQFLGIKMIGDEKIDDFISVYFEHNLREHLRKSAKLFWIMHPAAPGTFIAHHIEKRWVYHFPIFPPYESIEDYPEEVLKQRILTALGDEDIPLEISSISLWRMTCQIADCFRMGRAFLVGDAAHRFPPTGGLGMNSGIGDVQNLCWKMAYVLKGLAGNELLATYEKERRPVIEQNSEESLRNYYKIWEVPDSMGLNPKAIKWQAILLNSFPLKFLPKKWINTLLAKVYESLSKKILSIPHKPPLHQKVKDSIKDQIEHFDRIGLDLGYVYEEGAIIPDADTNIPQQGVSEYVPSIEPGVRFPHYWITSGSEKISSHAWLSPTSFTLLCNGKGEKWWQKEKVNIAPEILSFIQLRNVESNINQASIPPLVTSFYPIDNVPLLLIRPDGQIAWRPKSLDIDIKSVFSQLIPSV
ncbi:MAG: FAD-dependent monooxygenase [Bacteroidota bacterium]